MRLKTQRRRYVEREGARALRRKDSVSLWNCLELFGTNNTKKPSRYDLDGFYDLYFYHIRTMVVVNGRAFSCYS